MELTCCTGGSDNGDCVELTARESMVCSAICQSHEPVSFSELKKSTDFHQEILSRIVRRLVVHGVVKKIDGRYKGECGQ